MRTERARLRDTMTSAGPWTTLKAAGVHQFLQTAGFASPTAPRNARKMLPRPQSMAVRQFGPRRRARRRHLPIVTAKLNDVDPRPGWRTCCAAAPTSPHTGSMNFCPLAQVWSGPNGSDNLN
jgi:hypothetical protein